MEKEDQDTYPIIIFKNDTNNTEVLLQIPKKI